MKLALPARWGGRTAFREGEIRGVAYGEVPDPWREVLPGWVRTGRVPGGEDLRAERVFRCGDVVVKFFAPPGALARWLRTPAAQRSAERYFHLQPIASPRPLLALGERGGSRPSMLLSEFVHGPHLDEVWREEGEGCEALPGFLADMHRRGIYHGDLHPANIVWHEGTWVLLDLDALRTGLHAVRSRELVLGQWTRMACYLGGNERLAEAFRSYHRLSRLGGEPDALWRKILVRAEEFDRKRRLGWETS